LQDVKIYTTNTKTMIDTVMILDLQVVIWIYVFKFLSLL
jgi:hypothetical protein